HLLVAVADLQRGRYRWLALRTLPTLGVLAALAWSLAQGAGGGRGGDADAFGLLLDALPRIASLALHALGSAWLGVEVYGELGWSLGVASWLGLVSVVLALAGLGARLARGLRSGSLLPLYLLAYGALTALSVAAARGEGGPGAVMASR